MGINAVIGQSGGPTAVINQSLVGVVQGLREGGFGGRILGMRHGVSGLVRDEFADMTDLDDARLDRLAASPSAGLGSTREKPDAAYCQRILEACKKNNIGLFFYIGGNDSSDTCRIVNELAKSQGMELRCFHVPKTVDNDLMANDHTPGFPSAARFVAMACAADGLDNASIPGVKINVIMGRHAGFLTAASALARDICPVGAPHLIYVPEVAFSTERFVEDVARVLDAQGRCQVAVSEGVQNEQGESIGATLIKSGQVDDHGNVQLSGSGALGDALSDLLKEKLAPIGGKAPRVRADTFGYLQRCWPDASPVDQDEARGSGRFAASLAMGDHVDGSVAIVRVHAPGSGQPYAAEYKRVELSDVAAKTRHLPAEFINGHSDVSAGFMDYCRPLVGRLPRLERM